MTPNRHKKDVNDKREIESLLKDLIKQYGEDVGLLVHYKTVVVAYQLCIDPGAYRAARHYLDAVKTLMKYVETLPEEVLRHYLIYLSDISDYIYCTKCYPSEECEWKYRVDLVYRNASDIITVIHTGDSELTVRRDNMTIIFKPIDKRNTYYFRKALEQLIAKNLT